MTDIAAPAPAPAAPAPAPAAPAPAPAAPSPAPAAPAPAPAPGADDSLLAKPGAPAPAPAPATTDDYAFLPEKYRVMDKDGKLDLAASAKKLGEGYGNLEKKLGTGGTVPQTADAYTYTPPEQFKDVALDDALSQGFRERALAKGISQEHYEFIMGEYFQLVPQLFDSAAKLSATEARAELSKVWTTPAELDAGVKAASRAVGLAPEGVRDNVWVKFGRDPDFIQFAASLGREMAEDTSIPAAGGAASGDVDQLLAHPAVRDPKHPEHAKISKQISEHFAKKYGSGEALQ